MNPFRRLAFYPAVLALVAALAPIASAIDKGKPAPDFTLKTLSGQEVSLASLKGKVVVLDFWATWCPPCRKSLPHINHLSQDAARTAKGLQVLAVNCREPAGKVKSFVEKQKYGFEVALDQKGQAMQGYGVTGIPMTVVVGRDGNVDEVFVGYGGKSEESRLDAAVDHALAQK